MRALVLLIPILILAVLGAAFMVGWRQPEPKAAEPITPAGVVQDSSRPGRSPAPAADTQISSGLRVRVLEVGPGRYEVSGPAVRAMLDNAGGGLSDLALTVTPMPSLESGIEYRISSVIGGGVLTNQGFRVTDPKLAGAAGIEAGDVVLAINGAPVGGFLAGLLAMRRDPDRRTIEIELDRRGTRLIQTYRIR